MLNNVPDKHKHMVCDSYEVVPYNLALLTQKPSSSSLEHACESTCDGCVCVSACLRLCVCLPACVCDCLCLCVCVSHTVYV